MVTTGVRQFHMTKGDAVNVALTPDRNVMCLQIRDQTGQFVVELYFAARNAEQLAETIRRVASDQTRIIDPSVAGPIPPMPTGVGGPRR